LVTSLLINTTGLALDRVIFKFVEKDFEKLRVLVQMHNQYYRKLSGEFDLSEF
jgi:hypothetical protein